VTVAVALGVAVSGVAAAALAGADLCVPGVNPTVNRVVAAAAGLEVGDLCVTEPFNVMCHYQTCEGTSPLQGELSTIEETKNSMLAIIDGIKASYNNETCLAQLDAVALKVQEIGHELTNVTALLECPSINYHYVTLTDRALCDGVFRGLGAAYIFIYTSVIAFFVLLVLHELLDFTGQDLLYNTPGDRKDTQVSPLGEF
jgi:hypothetical protein